MSNSGVVKKKILVVEDEAGIRQVCRRALTSEGFEVDVAVNGKVAEDLLGEKGYHLCLIDIRTPVMNGKQLYQYIEDRYPGLMDGVIFTTGDAVSDDTQSFVEQTGRPFLLKPFTPDELTAIGRETLSRLS